MGIKKNVIQIIKLTIILLAFFLSKNSTFAATLQVSPASAKISVGNIVSVKFTVNTEGKSINNVDGIALFPADLLEVISVSKGSSIFTLWVEDPKFSNSIGQITFNGGVPNPGYNGNNGEIVSVTFKAKKQGIANILYSDSAVRENNGLGTDILSTRLPATIQIDLSNEDINVKPVLNIPDKPVVLSSTHPDQDKWYQGTNASFSWNIPDGVTSIQTLFNKSPSSAPTVAYDNTVSQRTVSNLTDGVLYFHIRYINNNGNGPIAHYKIQVDNTPPDDFDVMIRKEGVRDVVTLKAYDKTSGIDSYSIKIDSESAFRIKSDLLKDNDYILPVKNAGEHSIIVSAYDRAGNYSTSKSTYISENITKPEIQVDRNSIVKGENINIKGNTDYALSDVKVFIQHGNGNIKTYTETTDKNGSFILSTDKFDRIGVVSIWAQNYFGESIISPISNKISIRVNDTALVRTTKSISYTLLSLIIVISLLTILILLLYMGWHKFFGLKRKISKELDNTTKEIHKALTLFKEELGDQLEILEKTKVDRDLNRKEEKIFKDLQSNIDNIDDFIDKKIKKIK
jgi:type II secretory pathway pseudopilin PulG